MRNRFDRQLSVLNREMIEMGALCEDIFSKVLIALNERNKEVYEEIVSLGSEIDRKERSIETLCLKLLLQQQPVARDLRQISAALKMITDMERIGDQVEDIAEIIPFIDERSDSVNNILNKMAQASITMVKESIDAFVAQDIDLAKKVLSDDDTVDECFDEIKLALVTELREDREDGESFIDLIMIAKYFERIGDHATNIAEWVIFSVTGVHKEEDL